MDAIKVSNLTKKYAPNVGCFDINLTVAEGDVYGFIGPNGAGKTTVIRHLIGFLKPDSGAVSILELDAWKQSNKIMEDIGYLAGEVTLPSYMSGLTYLKTIAEIRKNVNWDYVEKLIEYFDFDPKRKIGKMSKGMKQKVAIVNAFMHKPKVLILDEPTSGLDPLMQEKFNKLVENAKKSGTTVFISSHIFGEIENTCDRVGFIKKGHLISEIDLLELNKRADKVYEIQFKSLTDFNRFIKATDFEITKRDEKKNILQITVPKAHAKSFLSKMEAMNLDYFREVPFNLEQYFLKFYGDEVKFDD